MTKSNSEIPDTPDTNGIGKGILVVGGGISGITTALEAAEVGYRVILVEKLPYLGGRVAGMNQYFPKLCPPWCGLEINFRRIRENPRITFFTSTIVAGISGSEGDFKVTLTTLPEYVNSNCTLCGECVKVCPVDRENDFNYGLDKTKAIYFPHEMAFPAKYVIDGNVCLMNQCKKCLSVCKYNAIDLKMNPQNFDVHVGSVVFATGWKPYDPENLTEFQFGSSPDVITSLMMERLASPNGPNKGRILRPSDNTIPKNLVFIQCAGSRDENHLPYCSSVCCSASLKQALNYINLYPDGKVKIFYIDLRVAGRNEGFLNRVENTSQIELIKGKVAKIIKDQKTGQLIVEAEAVLSGTKITASADLVILATGIVPNEIPVDKIAIDEYGFISADELPKGIYATACSKKPLDVYASLKDATGIALKAIQSARTK
jgi:quinone-modifying oxidoreductase subunit QmoA